ncbi:type I restriction-modification system, S subunit [Steroidobacter denitrificans]|uniref:Type I restriction-modification system, S subunit n=1 Tax=Steroidobacter denitrificans TaxID=465721 RepID=A0A127F7I3_STEDE|nr:restriction endonuclease subunit S [Steroidobacter denitrificans]AMN45520.1 type I restriction-modification system, S subunit [Steroidobacter denitrificans]
MVSELHAPALGEVVDLVRGTTYRSALLGQPGPVLLGLASIQRNGGFRDGSLKTYGGDSAAKLLLAPGDLYVSLKDVTQSADLLGAIARVPSSVASGRLTQDTVKLQFKDGNYPHILLYWTLRTPQYRAYCRSHATGTTNLGLPREDFLAYRLPAPTSDTLSLATILEALDNRIELNRRMSETLEAMARALFKSWFVDFDPVRAKATGHDPDLPNEIADLFPSHLVDSELGEIPEGWEVATLADFADLNPETWTKQTRPTEIRYVDLSSTKWGRIETVTVYTEADAPSRAQRVLRPGDTIVGIVRPGNGSYALISEGGLTGSTGFAVLRPRTIECTEIVYLAATSADNIEALAHLADGGAYPAIRPEAVAGTRTVRPTDDVLARFSSITRPIIGEIARSERESRTLSALRDALLPKLISGELQVAGAKTYAEGGQR